jgi:hypothetical protein
VLNGERIGHCRPGDSTYPSRSPLAVAALEDKIVQRATATLLNAIYEEDFLGFRTGSGPDAARIMRWMRSWSESGSRKVNFSRAERQEQVIARTWTKTLCERFRAKPDAPAATMFSPVAIAPGEDGYAPVAKFFG